VENQKLSPECFTPTDRSNFPIARFSKFDRPPKSIELPVGEKHLGDNIGHKTNNFMSKCFALSSRKNLARDRAFDRSETFGENCT
jgi:hypothetical protein